MGLFLFANFVTVSLRGLDHEIVKQGLGLSTNERIVGFLYLGHASGKVKPLPRLDMSTYFHEWCQEPA
jgi:hypothetical protein